MTGFKGFSQITKNTVYIYILAKAENKKNLSSRAKATGLLTWELNT